MRKALRRFARGLKELREYLLLLKQLCCPFCGAAETLNCHSKLYGNDPNGEHEDARMQRGQRVWCSNRGQREGCGRSFSLFLAGVLPRHTVSAAWLWKLLQRLARGGSVKAAVEGLGLPFALESIHHVLDRLREQLATVRSVLSQESRFIGTSCQTDPLLQTAEHLRQLFPESDCPCTDFQLHFQRPLLE